MKLNIKSALHIFCIICAILMYTVLIWEIQSRNSSGGRQLPFTISQQNKTIKIRNENVKVRNNTIDPLKYNETMKAFSIKYRNHLVKIQKHLSTAHRYSRSAKSILEIFRAFQLVEQIINVEDKERLASHLHHQRNSGPSGSEDNLVDVCPEVKLAKGEDVPMMNIQLKIANCSNSRPLNTIVGFVIMTPNCSTARDIVKGIVKNYMHMEASVGIESSGECNIKDTYSSSFKLLDINIGMNSTGKVWKTLVEKLSTKYALIVRNLYTFTNESSLERLVQIISESGIEAVGGPQRFDDGRWMSGCYQMAMRNYTLRLLEGYDLSYKSCMYCDYLSTAFLTRRQNLLTKLDDQMIGNSVFIDYFIQLFNEDRIGALMCADVMFSSDYQDINDQPRSVWRQIVIKYSLNRILLPNNQDVWFDCVESKVGCPKKRGEVVPPCCLTELNEAFLLMMKICYKRKLNCTMVGGSTFGSLKFYGVIPWERDHDLLFRSKNYSEFGNELRKHGYRVSYVAMRHGKSDICRPNNFDCMYFGYHTKYWRIQMYGARWITTDNRGSYREPTRTLYNGVWLDTYTNPGRFLRIMYGDDIFKHVEHWMTLGYSSSWSNYGVDKNGVWMKCRRPENFHGCLHNFMPSGNIQFNDVWI